MKFKNDELTAFLPKLKAKYEKSAGNATKIYLSQIVTSLKHLYSDDREAINEFLSSLTNTKKRAETIGVSKKKKGLFNPSVHKSTVNQADETCANCDDAPTSDKSVGLFAKKKMGTGTIIEKEEIPATDDQVDKIKEGLMAIKTLPELDKFITGGKTLAKEVYEATLEVNYKIMFNESFPDHLQSTRQKKKHFLGLLQSLNTDIITVGER